MFSYRFECENDWDILTDNPKFYVWVWDYYNNGAWMELEPEGTTGSYYFEIQIPYNMVGAKIVRMDPDGIVPDWSAEWNSSDDLKLSGLPGTILFNF